MNGIPIVLAVLVGLLAVIGLAALVVAAWAGPRLRLAWRVLRDPAAVQRLAAPRPVAAPAVRAEPAPAVHAQPKPARSEALSLLGILQQEARLMDFFKESLEGYSDAQIGAVVRDVQRDGAAVLERLFAVRPLRQEPEGADVGVPPGFDAATLRLTGKVAGQPPYRGTLRHPGWEATRVELPVWTGSPAAARVIAPAEVEIR
jgi:Domain of unknown function (DUF2760)